MEGKNSYMFTYYKILICQGLIALRAYVDSLIYLLQIMNEESDLPCFTEFEIEIFRSRFKEKFTDEEV